MWHVFSAVMLGLLLFFSLGKTQVSYAASSEATNKTVIELYNEPGSGGGGGWLPQTSELKTMGLSFAGAGALLLAGVLIAASKRRKEE